MRALLILWLLLQAAVPLYLKFDLPHFRYRNRHFSWGMYGSLKQDYSVSLRMGDGQAIPDIQRFVVGYSSPGWMVNPNQRMSPAETEAWLAELLRHIATSRNDGQRYTAVVVWRRPQRPTWSFAWPAD